MMKAVLHIAFDELKLHRVTLGVYDFNISAISCYEKIGFVKEGLLRESKKSRRNVLEFMGNEYVRI